MRVNEVICRCRVDQYLSISYNYNYINGFMYDIIDSEEYRENRIGDMIVTNIGAIDAYDTTTLYIKAVKA